MQEIVKYKQQKPINYLPQTSTRRPQPKEAPKHQDRGNFLMGAADGFVCGLILGGAMWLAGIVVAVAAGVII